MDIQGWEAQLVTHFKTNKKVEVWAEEENGSMTFKTRK